MKAFIEDYLHCPTSAITTAQQLSQNLAWASDIDEDMIYDTLASGEFRLYEEIIFSMPADDLHKHEFIRPVA
jgi:hypothetical protein